MIFLKENWFKMIGILLIIVVAILVLQEYNKYLSLKASDTQKNQQTPISNNNLQVCLDQAQSDYQTQIGDYTVLTSDGNLIVPIAAKTELDSKLKNDQDTCIKSYK